MDEVLGEEIDSYCGLRSAMKYVSFLTVPVVDEPLNDRGLAGSLVAEENQLVLGLAADGGS